ncbi:MAG: ABC transporter permease [Candidatus Electryonea clarkiae]|nr:ABC transporter permease [Candidatus Electryonea clarkiae]
MLKYLTRSIILGVVTILGIAFLIFTMIKIAPGSPVDVFAPNATPEIRQQIIEQYGLDKPAAVQFLRWVGHLAQGDLGRSYMDGGIPIRDLLWRHIPATVNLLILSYFISLVLALPLGMYMGMPKRGISNTIIGGLFDLIGAIPDFWMARLLIIVFAVMLRWFPISYQVVINPDELGFFGYLSHSFKQLILPAIALGLGSGRVSLFARHIREEIHSVLTRSYIELAIAKGIGRARVLWLHALPNSAIPLLTQITASIPTFLGATIIIEIIFSYPGLGILIYKSCIYRNYPVILAGVLVLSVTVTLLNVIHDIFHYALDPKARL